MSRPRRAPRGVQLSTALALAAALVAPPAIAAGDVDPRAARTPHSVSAYDVKKKTAQAMPGPRKPGWFESVIGRLMPKPPKNTCRG